MIHAVHNNRPWVVIVDHERQRRSIRRVGQAAFTRHSLYSETRQCSWYISTTMHAIVSACRRMSDHIAGRSRGRPIGHFGWSLTPRCCSWRPLRRRLHQSGGIERRPRTTGCNLHDDRRLPDALTACEPRYDRPPKASMPTFPEWWNWDLSFTGHAELRMEQRGVTEVEVRAILKGATGSRPAWWKADS
jgi:hypothetical protein